MASQTPGLLLNDQLCFALYAATNAVVRAYRPMLAELGLTYPQYLLMLALWQDGSGSVHALAERLRLGPNAITPLVDRLEAAGFVTRARGTDRRVVLVALTKTGIGLEAKVSVAQQSVVCRVGLADRDLAALRKELQDLTDRLTATGEARENEAT
ncbi:MarR family winged helix-turn-helix transcriptional regulator [Methylobacterium sp. E-046]|uniref:MarR family winged helix-turn-helix transcriptional regulator n=1 Tax=Methylobacterium sp. E-046 TaxID=2836576 RepID=UPI001FBA8819|nr:MarR family transcriptional regulator [Methylobacterium sp. E-046]MCJ2100707.1 MarR family transcriptional regulator [Methylobacterium sp. E-046]